MIFVKPIRNRKLQSPVNYFKRPFSLSAHFVQSSNVNTPKVEEKPITSKSGKQPLLSTFFKQVVGISGKNGFSEVEVEAVCENAELKEKLKKMAEEADRLDKRSGETGVTRKPESESLEGVSPSGVKPRLSDWFTDKRTEKGVKVTDSGNGDAKPYKLNHKVKLTDYGNEDHTVYKPLSPDMLKLAYCLYSNGHLKNANFMPENKFDPTCFETGYAREYLKRAAIDFGKDHQVIVKWLSGSDLKTIALFGCPSLGERSVRAAKHLRRFFKIDEQQVCQKCILKESCKLANKKAQKDYSKLFLSCVTRLLVMYALESVPQQLVVPEEVKDSVSRLLKELISLSETETKNLPKTPVLQ